VDDGRQCEHHGDQLQHGMWTEIPAFGAPDRGKANDAQDSGAERQMKRLHRSLIFTFSDRYLGLAINLATLAILARLLTPAQFGIVGITTAFMALTNTIRDFGVGTYLIQVRDLTVTAVQTAFTLTAGLSILAGATLFLASGPIAGFYGQAEISSAIKVSAASFAFLPVSMTITGILRREMAFGVLAICNLTMVLVTAITSVTLAMLDMGYMAPVWGSVAGNAAIACMAFALRPRLAFFNPSLAGWRDVLSYGSYASGTMLINVLFDMAPQLILGRVLNMTAVGLYTRGVASAQLFDRLITDAVSPIIMPSFSERARTGANLKPIYLLGIEHLSVIRWPALIFLALMAEPVVQLLFGQGWREIVPIMRWLSIAYLVLFPAALTYPTLVAVGRVRDAFTTSIISVPLSIAILLVAAPFGLEAVAASAILAYSLQVLLALTFIRRWITFTWSDMGRSLWRSFVVTLGSNIGPGLILVAYGANSPIPLPAFGGAVILGGVGWLCSLFITGHPLGTELVRVAGALSTSRRPLPLAVSGTGPFSGKS
jgi:O-antigen/teichoic acid export membrane protein